MTIPTSRLLLCCVVAVLLLAGCGDASHHRAPKPPVTTSAAPSGTSAQSLPGFLSIYPSPAQPLAAYFIQWQRTGSTVTGTLSVSVRNPQSGATGTSSSFTGTISGQSVGLDIGGSFNQRENGTLRDNQLTLAFASSDGSLQTLVFVPATVADYNAAVANVKAGGVAQGRQQARAQADARARQAIDADVSTVTTDIQNLSGPLASAQSDLASMAGDLKKAKDDLAKTLADKKNVVAEAAKYPGGNNGQVCYDASGVDYDASGVSYDENGVSGYDSDGITNDLNNVTAGSATLRADFQKLQADQAALPSYRPAGAPSAAVVTPALASAASAARQIGQTMASYIAQTKQLLRTANAYDAEAQAACKKVGG